MKKESKRALKKVFVMATVKGDIPISVKKYRVFGVINNGFEIVISKDVDCQHHYRGDRQASASLIGFIRIDDRTCAI